MQNAFAALEKDLKRLCRFDSDANAFELNGFKFSIAPGGQGARPWLEVVIDVQPLNTVDPVETIASALGANYYHLRGAAQPVSFGLKNDPPMLVLIFRLDEIPATQDALAMLRRFAETAAELKAACLPNT